MEQLQVGPDKKPGDIIHVGIDSYKVKRILAKGVAECEKIQNSFSNGRTKAQQEIANKWPVLNANMDAFQRELGNGRLGSKIWDFIGVGSDSVTIKPGAPDGIRQLVVAAAKAHKVKVNNSTEV